MKKTIQIILAAAITLSLQACSDKKNDYDFKVDTTDPQSPYYINHDDDRPMP
ncbi:MAG: hypothetical protein FAF03_09975 [Epsilonproteobacteria bacterium]|nr:hypothetical protein [Campylobacterota bacterium]